VLRAATFWDKEKENLPPWKITFKVAVVFQDKAYRILGIFLPPIAVDLVLDLFIFYIDIVVLSTKTEMALDPALFSIFHDDPRRGGEEKGKCIPALYRIPLDRHYLAFIWIDSGSRVFCCVFLARSSRRLLRGNQSSWAC
jgi:hypothetical protein